MKNNRGINNGTDLPRPFLEAAYAAVVAEEIVTYDWVPARPSRRHGSAAEVLIAAPRSIGAEAAATARRR